MGRPMRDQRFWGEVDRVSSVLANPPEPTGAIAGYFPDVPFTSPGPTGDTIRYRRAMHLAEPGGHRGQAPRKDVGRHGCREPVAGKKRCPQCWAVLAWPAQFTPRGRAETRLNCNDCCVKMRGKTNARRAAEANT